ncbi:MAG: serine/threonine protein kinase [Deltaproteobacteria bacterium]|nr:serine/threonine protein kinase [Deltaproteobacteria bacterium]
MPDLPSWLSPGVVVDGKYELVRLLGQGGMGVVYEARHKTLGERVALKAMLSGGIPNAEMTARFLREARSAFAVKNEHVARVLDAGTGPSGEPYLVMELLEGSDLMQLVKTRGPLPIADAVEYAAQAAAALAAAHAHGIVHRDVKPANLFLTRRPDGSPLVKVLDFGIAKANEPSMPGLTETNVGMGTLLYMSPEQVKAARDVDARADIYSLGATLYELLGGRSPYQAPSGAELIVQILHVDAPPLSHLRPDLPAALDLVVARSMKRNRDERFPTMEAFASAMRAAALDAPRGTPPLTPQSGPSALASTAGPATMQQLPPPMYAPPVHAAYPQAQYGYPSLPNDGMYRGPAYGAYGAMPMMTPPRRTNVPLTIFGIVVTTFGVLSFVASAIPGVVNGSETGTAIAIGLAACVVGGVLLAAGLLRR